MDRNEKNEWSDTMGTKTVSIILLNYNGEKYIDSCSPSLFKIDYPNYEIIFIDNGSTDNSLEKFKKISERFPFIEVKIIRLEKNVGYSRANNIGIEYTSGDYIVLLSNDIEVDKMWLSNMVLELESNKNIGLAQSMMYSLFDKNKPDKMGNYIDVLGFNYGFKPSEMIKDVFYSEGAVMFIRRNILNETKGLFDEDFFMFYEDIDFSWRVRSRGYKNVVVPSSKVYHARGGTVKGIIMKTQPLYVFHNTKNRLMTLYKNYDMINILRYMPITIFLELLKATYLLYNGNKDAGLSCFNAIAYFIKNISSIHKKRKAVQSIKIVKDNDIKKAMENTSVLKSIVHILKQSKDLSKELRQT